MTIKINNKEENDKNYTSSDSNNLDDSYIKYNNIRPTNQIDNINVNTEQSIQSEYKIIPKNDDKLCLMDPIILFWIVSITGILLYIVGYKFKSR